VAGIDRLLGRATAAPTATRTALTRPTARQEPTRPAFGAAVVVPLIVVRLVLVLVLVVVFVFPVLVVVLVLGVVVVLVFPVLVVVLRGMSGLVAGPGLGLGTGRRQR
jgi:hypothetical protein